MRSPAASRTTTRTPTHHAAAEVVLEVGPGLGSLTLGLLSAAAGVVAVEVDPRLSSALPDTIIEHARSYADHLHVVTADALHLDAVPDPTPTVLVANLP